MSRLGYDGEEGIYFDRTKFVSDPDMVDEEGNRLNEECDPVELCEELERELAAMREALLDIRVALEFNRTALALRKANDALAAAPDPRDHDENIGAHGVGHHNPDTCRRCVSAALAAAPAEEDDGCEHCGCPRNSHSPLGTHECNRCSCIEFREPEEGKT